MPSGGDYHAYKSTSGGSGGSGSGGGGGLGCFSWIVIGIVIILLISIISGGYGMDAIDSLLGFGFLAFLFVRSMGG